MSGDWQKDEDYADWLARGGPGAAGPVPGPAIDLDEIEARCVPPAGCDCDLCALIAEVKQLRQERDEAGLRWGEHYNAELARLRGALQAVRDLCDVVRLLQQPDPDTGDRAVSFLALLDALDPDDGALAAAEPGEQGGEQ